MLFAQESFIFGLMKFRKFSIQEKFQIPLVVLIALGVIFAANQFDWFASAPEKDLVTSDTKQHILYGSEDGGGHLYGQNKPCKSEFPKDWSGAKIIQVTKDIAANDNSDWRLEDNGYYVTEQSVQGVDVRVVLNEDRSSVVTSYPVNGDRNPCANDNAPQQESNQQEEM